MNRRRFLGSASWLVASAAMPALAAEGGGARPRVLFTKGLEHLSFEKLAAKVAALGISGLEAPLRKGGHIEPDAIADKLPVLVAALKKEGLTVEIAASDVREADKDSEAYLKALAASGVKRYRLGHHRYDLGQPIRPQLEEFRAKMKDLAGMNAGLGVQGQYQNHRGNNYIGAPVWDVAWALEEIDPANLGMAFDFAHATVEGANAWELNLRRAKDHIVSVYFKDYRLNDRNWSGCPLGEGVVNPKAGELVASLLPASTPVSLHVEYLKYGSEGFDAKMLEAAKKDFATLEKWLPAS